MVNPAYRETQESIERVFEKQIFFIVGQMRSGNTWVQFLLDAHPEICCRGEGHFTDALYPALSQAIEHYNILSSDRILMSQKAGLNENSPRYNFGQLNHIFTTAIGLAFMDWLGGSDVKCIGEKTPRNIDGLDLLDAVIPTAKYIHIIRDGRDAAVSTWVLNIHLDRDAQLKLTPSFNIFVEGSAKNWSRRVKQMRKFGVANSDRYFELRYEDLHREPEPVVRGLFEFLGVDAEDGVVSECISSASFERVTDGRQRGQEQAGARMRKGVVGDWRNHFDDTSRAIFRRHAGDLLKQLGYDD